jgi:hypothetical protein
MKKTFVGAGQMNDSTKDKNFGEKNNLAMPVVV